MTPLVSVVIPAYNAERYLAEAVESVFAQTCEPVEILIVNDGSTDRTEEIAHQVRAGAPPGKSVFVLSSPENQGAADALWTGFAVATGHYRTFLAADDAYVDPDHLARQVEAIQAAGADWSYYRDFSTGPTLTTRRPITPVRSRRRSGTPNAGPEAAPIWRSSSTTPPPPSAGAKPGRPRSREDPGPPSGLSPLSSPAPFP